MKRKEYIERIVELGKKLLAEDDNLTPEEQKLSGVINGAYDETLKVNPNTCSHTFTEQGSGEISAVKRQHWGSARCSICNKRFGWYCPDSPDHSCHYSSVPFTIDMNSGNISRRVIQNNGKYVPAPEGHEHENESYDWCIFCGEPEERK